MNNPELMQSQVEYLINDKTAKWYEEEISLVSMETPDLSSILNDEVVMENVAAHLGEVAIGGGQSAN